MDLLVPFGLTLPPSGGLAFDVRNPSDGALLARLGTTPAAEVSATIAQAHAAFTIWRTVPAPRRGELVRRIAERVRSQHDDLARLITAEVGKTPQEARGEVQEWIDLCDFAVGLSRQLHGLTIASERPEHRLLEQWHPLGAIGVISAFNFPVAVWAWNAMLALVCGDSVVWKPSEKAPLCALAAQAICNHVLAEFAEAPRGLLGVVIGGRAVGEALADDPRLSLLSATGSTAMGRAVAGRVAARFGRCLLELGGNNAAIVAPTADLALAERAIAFSAVGTAGQRCTTLRRLIVHRSLYDTLVPRLIALWQRLPVGPAEAPGTLVGPLIDAAAGAAMQQALSAAAAQGGRVHGGAAIRTGVPAGGTYVRPALVEIDLRAAVVQHETFAPILYVGAYDTLGEAIAINNAVPQGLSAAIFTSDLREAGTFLGPAGSDCGLTNVNVGTSGAEIGGAFGGEKDTGGGRESGSDAWKQYMRRATNTVNYGSGLPLAQGIRFTIED